MVKSIQQTEENIIVTVDDKIYNADIETFEREAGGSFPRLPTDVEYRIYEPGIRHALVGGHGKVSISGELPWAIGDNVINNIDEFMNQQAQAAVLAKLQEQAGYDDSVLEIQKQAKAVAEQRAKDAADALALYYKSKDGLKDYSANERWKKQIGGTTSATFGKIATDDKTQSMLTSLAVAISQKLVDPPINYKGVDEWITLSAEQVLALGKEVATFIQKCFSTELQVAADIEDGKITTTDEIDGAYKAF